MGVDTIPDRANAQTIDQTWFNLIKSVFAANLIPRNASGVPTTDGGSLGDGTYNWLKAYIDSGYFSLGDIKMHHSYNGAAPIGHGWMLCDGRQITAATYNTEHGANTFATYIVSTALLNLYLPNFTGRYPVGKATTTQDGSAPITSVGNASNVSNLSHSHTVSGHVHKWFHRNGDNPQQSHNSGGTLTGVTVGSTSFANASISATSGGAAACLSNTDLYTDSQTPGTDSQLASANIQPDSIEVLYYMRII